MSMCSQAVCVLASRVESHPSTLHPQPSPFTSSPSTLRPQPSPFTSQPSTLNPQPSTLSLTMCVIRGSPQKPSQQSSAGGEGAGGRAGGKEENATKTKEEDEGRAGEEGKSAQARLKGESSGFVNPNFCLPGHVRQVMEGRGGKSVKYGTV